MVEKSQKLLKEFSEMDCRYRNTDASLLAKIYSEEVDLDVLGKIRTIHYLVTNLTNVTDVSMLTNQIKDNGLNNIIRACVISADRLVSALSAEDLHEHIKHRTLTAWSTKH